jgi:hypothetical protein
MTRPVNNATKLTQEYTSILRRRHVEMLKIRFLPGMEMLAQELGTGQRIYEQDWADPLDHPDVSPASPFRPYEYETNGITSPTFDFPISPYPISPDAPNEGFYGDPPKGYIASPAFQAVQRRRAPGWATDATRAFPVLFIEAEKVQFYSTLQELEAAIKNRGDGDVAKVIINVANVVSIERLIAYEVFSQNVQYEDVANGAMGEVPPIVVQPFAVTLPETIPTLANPTEEMMFRIEVAGGQAPYRFSLIGAPKDLYVSTDGWVRGFIEEDQWPLTGYREFLMRVLVEDSSIPVQSAIFDLRYRVFPAA